MTAESIVAIILVSHLRKSLKTKQNLPGWEKILLGLLFASIGLLVLSTIDNTKNLSEWLAHLLLIIIVVIAYKNEEFKPSRTVVYSVIPLLVTGIVDDSLQLINPEWYRTVKPYLKTAAIFSFIWMIAMLVFNNRQRKAIKEEEFRRELEEEHKKTLEAKKTQLEVQVAERTAELTMQKEELQQTLTELKATQSQLIQQEKMASLGELTAGIAHEIQNPLNFVNNFSEVSIELLDEMEIELRNNNLEEVIAITKDIKQNLGKINQHGKRADSIVKGMLQHSRSTTGTKEPADINALADEYLRLSYHGLRAKDKSFNATMKTNYDADLGKATIVAQDIGRVLLNLFNNAFYSVSEKKEKNIAGYEPVVSVETVKENNQIKITVEDNGIGIPQKVVDKIYQPFFTTKPTGEGTGLGLSMSYDIITKGHSGKMTVETEEGEFARFCIIIPIIQIKPTQ